MKPKASRPRTAFLAALLVLAAPLSARSTGAADRNGALAEIRRVLGAEAEGSHDPREVSRELAALGADAIPPLIQIYLGAEVPGVTDLSSEALRIAPDKLVNVSFEALVSMAPSSVIRTLQAMVTAQSPVPVRLAALDVLGGLATSKALPLTLGIMESFEGPQLASRGVRTSVRITLVRLLSFDQGTVLGLREVQSELSVPSQAIVIEALREARNEDGLDLLLRMFTSEPKLRLEAVAAIEELYAERPWRFRLDPRDTLRQVLAETKDVELQRRIAVALAKFHDTSIAQPMTRWLESPDERSRSTAVWALEQLAGMSAPRGAAEWRGWLHVESRWWAKEGAALLADAQSEDPARIVPALRELAKHHFHIDRIAPGLESMLSGPETEIAVLAATTLGNLRSTASVPTLLETMYSGSAQLKHAAWSALRKITGQDLPQDLDAWDAWAQR